MSASFTIHLPKGSLPGDARALERAEIVRDGFSWGAFVLPTVWFLWHRHWVLAALALIGTLGLSFGLAALGAPAGALFAIEFLVHLCLGLEASSLRRLAYGLRGRPVTGLVIAADAEDAETKSFTRWLEGASATAAVHAVSAPAPVRVAPAIRRVEGEPVLGLFPDAERRR
jgi:hypothetical protein